MNEKSEALRLADALRDGLYLLSSERDATEAVLRRLHADNERLKAENKRMREALDKSLTDEQIKQIDAMIDRAMPLGSAKILFARAIEAALKEVQR